MTATRQHEVAFPSGRTAPGDLVLLVGIGSGSSWTCAIIEPSREPG